MAVLKTERLVLTELSLTDAPFILQLTNTAEWLQFIGDRGIKTIEDAENYISKGPQMSYAKWGHGLYRVSLKNSGIPVGMCGIIQRDTLPHKDIGFALLPQYTGNGYAQEAAAAILEDAKERLGIEKIVAITLPNNSRSIALLGKLHMTFDKMIRLANGNEDLMLFTT